MVMQNYQGMFKLDIKTGSQDIVFSSSLMQETKSVTIFKISAKKLSSPPGPGPVPPPPTRRPPGPGPVPPQPKPIDYIPLPTIIWNGKSDINAKDDAQEIFDKVKTKLGFSEIIRIKFSHKSSKYYPSNFAAVNQACFALSGQIEIDKDYDTKDD